MNFDKICIFHKHLRSSCGAERKFVKKIYRSEFLQSSFISVIYLLKEVYRRIISEIHFAKLDMRIFQRLALNIPKAVKEPKSVEIGKQ